MNSETCCSEKCRSACAYFVAVLASLLIMVALVALMKHYTAPEPSKAGARDLERMKAGNEVRGAAATALTAYGWENQAKGIVRLPVNRAVELILQDYKDPAAGRAKLIARSEKANPAPASTFE